MSGYPVILNGDHAEFEAEWAGKDPKTRPDWPLPSFDARDWAEAFDRFNPGHNIPEGVMLGWFANSLMRGFDEHASRSATPAQPAGAVPDSLRAEAFLERHQGWMTKDEWSAAKRDLLTLLASHPAGQIAGSGADSALTCTEAECAESYKIGQRDGYDEGVQDAAIRAGLDGEYRASSDPDRHVPDASTMLERIAERVDGLEVSLARATKPAPDSTRAGQREALRSAMIRALDGHTAHSRDCHMSGDYLCQQVWPLVEAALAAHPAAPEAQGAWQRRAERAEALLDRSWRKVLGYPWPQVCKHLIASNMLSDMEEIGFGVSRELAESVVKANDAAALAEPQLTRPLPAPPASSGQGGR